MSDLEWIIEFEHLPPNSLPLPPEEPEQPPPDRPWWLLPLAGLVLLGFFFLFYLWFMGGRTDPVPEPDALHAQLEAIVRVEINALNHGDVEIYNRLQDTPWRRLRNQPPFDQWHTGREHGQIAGDIQLVELEMLSEEAALANIELVWAGEPYRLTWLYRFDGKRWQHTDWLQFETANTTTGSVRPTAAPSAAVEKYLNVSIKHHERHAAEAQAILELTDGFVTKSCNLLACPQEPFTITVELDDFFSLYYAGRMGPLHYRLPSPLRIRWPSDSQPENTIVNSLCRHIAFDLFAHPYQDQLSSENRIALTLATFWLAHHQLAADILPTTRWLEQASEEDGMDRVGDFIQILAAGMEPQEAVRQTFSPETQDMITNHPDYFGWLTLVLDPHNRIRPNPGLRSTFPLAWYPPLETRLDLQADPWAPDGNVYGDMLPIIANVRHPAPEWAVATTRASSSWGKAFFFRRSVEGWTLARPDTHLMGEQRWRMEGPFEVTYWAWDEPYVSEQLVPLQEIYQEVADNFELSHRPVTVAMMPSPDEATMPQVMADVYVDSPSLARWIDGSLSTEDPLDNWNIAWSLLVKPFGSGPTERYYLSFGLFLWQLEQFGLDYGVPIHENFYAGMQNAEPPAEIDSPLWRPLASLWTPPMGEQETILIGYALLTVNYLVDQHGPEILPELYRALESADSMAEWVKQITDQSLPSFEIQWRAWVMARYSHPADTH